MQPSKDALYFRLSWGIAVLAVIGVVVGVAAVGIFAVMIWTDRRPVLDVFAGSMIVFFTGFGGLAADLLRRWRDVVAVDDQGLWGLRKSGPMQFIAWGDIGQVRVDDTMQRLVVCDRSSKVIIWLEYQLGDFEKLRALALQRAELSAQASGMRLFHHRVINKVVMAILAAPVVGFACAVALAGHGGGAAMLALIAAYPLAMIALDPTRLEIGAGAVVIRFPGWRRTVAFENIAEIGSEALTGVNGNVWSSAMIVRKRGRPIRLAGYREGALTLGIALRAALAAHGAGGAAKATDATAIGELAGDRGKVADCPPGRP